MTIKELSQLYWLNREIEEDKRRLDELEAMTTSPKSPKYDGMPPAIVIRWPAAWRKSLT